METLNLESKDRLLCVKKTPARRSQVLAGKMSPATMDVPYTDKDRREVAKKASLCSYCTEELFHRQ